MVYLKYHDDKRQVVSTYDSLPDPQEGYSIAQSDSFNVGDEFEYTIWVNSVDDDGVLMSFTAIRNNPQAKRLLLENQDLKVINETLKIEVADLWFDTMNQEDRNNNQDMDIADQWFAIMEIEERVNN
ncbi:hypothetical protein [Geomicrobium sediminis]|uniref:Phage protein n=1 Tax=Geomicrobium sediminis TaxID=1347788 RepID=A0ABS2PEF7_9BACL|nr:hypothetical protein [Geomicrobium sediminis]MBM7633817.1 hypothetical protein [Geomicrobium sediminis]